MLDSAVTFSIARCHRKRITYKTPSTRLFLVGENDFRGSLEPSVCSIENKGARGCKALQPVAKFERK